jgi:6-pyruvoyltetrahydropterin/6-carboxytetrahydropterin synthase
LSHLVRLDGDSLRFAAAHFATFDNQLEPLHGHNYHLIVEISGSLTDDAWVIDFGRLKRIVREICAELDHKFLLQEGSRDLRATRDRDSWTVEFESRRYVMPVGDVVALPIENTTAERLAEWFAGRIAGALQAAGATNVKVVRVGVEEARGQSGWFSAPLT